MGVSRRFDGLFHTKKKAHKSGLFSFSKRLTRKWLISYSPDGLNPSEQLIEGCHFQRSIRLHLVRLELGNKKKEREYFKENSRQGRHYGLANGGNILSSVDRQGADWGGHNFWVSFTWSHCIKHPFDPLEWLSRMSEKRKKLGSQKSSSHYTHTWREANRDNDNILFSSLNNDCRVRKLLHWQ